MLHLSPPVRLLSHDPATASTTAARPACGCPSCTAPFVTRCKNNFVSRIRNWSVSVPVVIICVKTSQPWYSTTRLMPPSSVGLPGPGHTLLVGFRHPHPYPHDGNFHRCHWWCVSNRGRSPPTPCVSTGAPGGPSTHTLRGVKTRPGRGFHPVAWCPPTSTRGFRGTWLCFDYQPSVCCVSLFQTHLCEYCPYLCRLRPGGGTHRVVSWGAPLPRRWCTDTP